MAALTTEAFHALYQLIAGTGLPRPTLDYRTTVKSESATCSVAWPDLKIGFALDHDQWRPLTRAGWTVTPLSTASLNAIAPLLDALASASFAYKIHQSGNGAKRTISTDEQHLLAALLEVGLPTPDRNHTMRLDGLTITPDFCWETLNGVPVKVAVELDGWFHHGGRDLTNELKALAAVDATRRAQLLAAQKDQQAKDAAKRRALTTAGWTVLAVTDTELRADGAATALAATVAEVIATKLAAAAAP